MSFFLTMAEKRYDFEVSRWQNLDQKASNQIGFGGIVIAIFSFIFGSNGFGDIVKNHNFCWLIFGMGLILISIGIGIFSLIKLKKTIPVLNPEVFYDKYKTK